jgi:hypothetical protein
MKFTYSSGQRPLDGFTLKRGVGTGGFGEVYYALSDGGKEVALKLVRGHQDVELRGIAQCLNLKHPHLVGLYDLKTDAQGEHWVVLEYIAGEPLSVVLNRHPQGLPIELAQQWFLALAKAIAYLHDHGIVHRDLKPGNIFIESGILKVGDYGLSKFISSSQRTAQTQSVGTVYYMAPEISTGNYNKQVDIYAAGIILYEMLTGRVPFDGESAGEILMKHLTSPPDLKKLPAEYIPIVGKALSKNPAQRYATINEMAKAVEALGRPVDVIPLPAPSRSAAAPPVEQPVPIRLEEIPTVLPVISVRAQFAELSGSLAFSAVLATLLAVLYAAFAHVQNLTNVGLVLFMTVAICWAVLIPAKIWNNQKPGDSWMRRVIMMFLGTAVGAIAIYLNGAAPSFQFQPSPLGPDPNIVLAQAPVDPMAPPTERVLVSGPFFSSTPNDISTIAGYLSYFALALCCLRWWKMADRHRAHRFSAFPVIAAAFWALVLFGLIWPDKEQPYGAIALVTAAVIVQVVSPWEQPQPRPNRRARLRYA